MSGIGEGQQHAMRSMSDSMYLKTGDPGNQGGGTYTGQDADSIINAHMDLFGPAGRDIKIDSQRSKRHQRWHLSDVKLPASLQPAAERHAHPGHSSSGLTPPTELADS